MSLAAWPMAVQHDIKHALADNLSWLAILEGRPHTAARLRGYADARYAAHGVAREPNEASAVKQTERLTREQIGDIEFACLQREGSMLNDEAIVVMALSPEDTEAVHR